MHYILDHWYKLWAWLLENSASRATVILVFITGLYATLTWRMTKAISRQTRAIIQTIEDQKVTCRVPQVCAVLFGANLRFITPGTRKQPTLSALR